ncbi:MAG: D-amino acid aminotransferase [Pseudomonadota bacterium]
MTDTVYLNGQFVASNEARISIFDRSVLFGDAVYEVAGVMDRKLIDFEHHMSRLFNSLSKLRIPPPLTESELLDAFREMVRRNSIAEGMIYLQITRGEAPRDFAWPENLTPNVFMFAAKKSLSDSKAAATGVQLISTPDLRWARRDIKSVNLLGQVLAKHRAQEAGAYEALLHDEHNVITECGSTSFFIIRDGAIITRPLSNDILPGVTRRAVIELAETENYSVEQRPVSLDEARSADEAFITGASSCVIPVTHIDNESIGNAKPGPITRRVSDIYLRFVHDTLT